MNDVVDATMLRKLREEADKITRRMRLQCAAQMIAAARELIAGDVGYLERGRELETIQHELEDDSL